MNSESTACTSFEYQYIQQTPNFSERLQSTSILSWVEVEKLTLGGRVAVTLNPHFPTLYLAYREDRSSLHHMYCTALCVHSNLSKEHHFSAIVPCWRSKGDSVYRSHESLCTLWLHWSSNFRGVDTKLDTSCTNSKPRQQEEISLSYEMKC